MEKTTDTTKKVMDRIYSENKWAIPAHKKKSPISKSIRNISLILSILFLVGISVSLIFVTPSTNNTTDYLKETDITFTNIKSTDYAKAYSNLGFVGVSKGMIASIGEPKIYKPDENNNQQMFLMLAVLGIAMITLFLSWLSSENNSNHT